MLGRANGARSGATLLAIVGVHGNERAGVHAARRVLDKLSSKHDDISGGFVAIAGNLPALNHEDPSTRYIDADMNRICVLDASDDAGGGGVEHAEMRRLMEAVAHEHATSETLVCVDLHTTSAPSTPIVALEDSLPARGVVGPLPMPRYLGIEEELPGTVFDAITHTFRCVSFLIEGGQHDDPVSIDVHEASLWVLLEGLGIVGDETASACFGQDPARFLRRVCGDTVKRVYDLRHRESIKDPDFNVEPGIFSGTRVQAGRTLIARQGGEEMIAPMSGEVFLPNMQPHKRVGDDAYFIVRRVGTGWVNLSARLRDKAWVHRLVAALPGVHRGAPGELIVDRDVAAAMKRQVFHLLGYRLVRHEAGPSKGLPERVGRGIRGMLRGLIRRTRPDPRDPKFWVVRRRVLDVDHPRQ